MRVPAQRAALGVLLLALAAGCAGSAGAAAEATATTAERPPSAGDEQPAGSDDPTAANANADDAPLDARADRLPEPPPDLPPEVDGGAIPRPQLDAVLQRGVGRFLQQVQVERFLVDGRFHGWLLHSLFEAQPLVQQACVLKPGDIVLRVNNHSVERPEQFLAVWQSLSAAAEINIDVVRAGKPSRVRYLIVD